MFRDIAFSWHSPFLLFSILLGFTLTPTWTNFWVKGQMFLGFSRKGLVEGG